MFEAMEKTRETAQWKAAFGEPQVVEGRTLIPVAKVFHGFGLGFGRGSAPVLEEDSAQDGEGGGGGGGASAQPLGVIVVTPKEVYYEPTVDLGKLWVARMIVAVVIGWQFLKTLRAIFGR
jgi:uncharacterized spore protein YtfJ